jgi:hypothetical protein
MRNPGLRANLFLSFDEFDKDNLHSLKQFEGVTDYYVNESEEIIVIKYDLSITDEESLRNHLHLQKEKND